MCLKLNEIFKTREEARGLSKKPLIAGRAIKAYKLLLVSDYELEFFSPHRGAQYKPGEEKRVKKFSFEFRDVCGIWRLAVNKGLHSYKTKEHVEVIISQSGNMNIYVIAECTIPKGTPYFENDNEYVSLKLNLPSLSFDFNKKKKILIPNNKWEFHFNDKGISLEFELSI